MLKQLIARAATIVSIFAVVLLGSGSAFAQNQAISGKVLDAGGQPVIGAAVMVPGTTNGATTNLDGKFELRVAPGATLEVSCIGYATKRVAAANGMTITLEDDTEMLEETVVIGYGVQKKSDLTGAVASVRADDLKNQSTSDAAAALQGKAAGVHVMTNGSPGSGAEIRVRGYSSNTTDASKVAPLYIVDGLQVNSIQYIDPSMIESIEILKDAASAAIYGAQAGNGVVLVTTKTGQDGRTSVSYSGKATLQLIPSNNPIMNRDQMLRYIALEYGQDYVDKQLADWDKPNSDYPGGVIDNNWINAYLAPSWSQQHSVSFSGGNKNGHFFVSLNYVNQDGVVRGDKDVYKRLTAQVNADYNIFKWLQVGTNNSIERWSTKSVSQRGYSSTFENMLTLDPLTPTYWKTIDDMPRNFRDMYDKVQAGTADAPYRFLGDENGFYANTPYSDIEGSPLAKRDASDTTNEGFNINGTLYANLNLFKGFTFTSRFGYRIWQSNYHNFTAPYYIGRGSMDHYEISHNNSTGFYYQWENFANYNRTFGKHTITAMAGMSYRENNSDNLNTSARGETGVEILTSPEPQFHYMADVKSDIPKTVNNNVRPSKSASLAYFARLIWSYDNRYSLQANFRADAFDSSKLPKNNRWGYFPSFSAGWTVSNEPFFKNNVGRDAVSFLKLRVSWGRNGNVNVLGGYSYDTTLSVGNSWYQYSVDQIGSVMSTAPNLRNGLPNPNLTWETSEQWDAGLDARFLNNRLTFTVDYFNKQTKDLIFKIDTPTELGASTSTVNGGRVLNEGWEFELGWKDTIGDFSYSISGNFSTLNNKVLELAARAGRIINTDASSTNYKIQTVFESGYPIWYLRGWQYEGMDANGDPQFMGADGKITTSPTTADMTFIGQGTPKFTYGININLAWKGIDFTLYGAGIGGNSILPVLHRTGFKNGLKVYLDGYENGTMPHPEKILAFDHPFWSSTGNLFDGSFFRIKQLQLGYTLPQNLTKKAAISNLRFYVSLDDFFTFTSYPGLDPETASTNNTSGAGLDWGSYPTMKKVILGVNLTF
jgi:TonB-linked SusC/RagA family outer membrane protein